MNHLLNSDYTNLQLHLTRRETEEGEDMTVALLASLCLVLGAAVAAVENSTETPPPPLGPLLSDYVVQVHSLRGKTNFLRVYLLRQIINLGNFTDSHAACFNYPYSPTTYPNSARLSDDVATIRRLVPLLQSAVKFEASVESIRPNQLGISIANETEKSLEEVLAQFSSIEAALDASGYSHIQFTPPALPQGTSQPSLPPFGACSKVQDHLQQYDVFVKLSIALLYLEKDVIILNNFYNTPSA